ncbi:MAG TPA: hypothetical protein VF324_02220, partial [Methanobacterium sp.]
AGECACISVHGANRLGGNSLLETVVFGRLVADKIIKDIEDLQEPDLLIMKSAVKVVQSKIDEILNRKEGSSIFNVKETLTETMFNKFGIFRNKQIMEQGLEEIKMMQEKLSHLTPNNKEIAVNQALIQFLELEGMLKIAEVVAIGAIKRKESRGSHTRIDYPDRDDDNYLKHTLAVLKEGDIDITYKSVNLGLFEPKERVY